MKVVAYAVYQAEVWLFLSVLALSLRVAHRYPQEKKMSLDVETPRASSSHLRDERESKDSYGLLEDADTLRATPRSYRYIHVWSWIGQFVLFLTSLFIALRRPAAPNCVEKLSSFCRNHFRHPSPPSQANAVSSTSACCCK